MATRSSAVVALALGLAACSFPPPADVAAVGGSVSGLWTGAVVTLRLTAGEVTEDVTVDGNAGFTFDHALASGASYVVEVVDDGPDHECAVTNGSGRIDGADVELAVECTNLIPHGLTLASPVPFTFTPRTTSYALPVSLLQQGVEVIVTGPTLTGATVAGQPVTLGQASASVTLAAGTTSVPVVVSKGELSQQYDLVFDRGAAPSVEAAYAQASNAGNNDIFGQALAAWGDYVAVGAPDEDSSTLAAVDDAMTSAGALYVLRRSGQTWLQTKILKGSAISAQRRFGFAAAMDNGALVVGAPGDGGRGSVYVFRLDAAGDWREEQRVIAPDAHAGDQFGQAVAIDGERIVVGAPGHDRAGSSTDFGQVYVYLRTGTSWALETTIRDPASPLMAGFGAAVALDGDTLIARDYRSNVRIYRGAGTSWTAEAVPSTCVGSSFAIDGDQLAVGDPYDASGNGTPGDTSAPDSGAVRLFSRAGSEWTQDGYLKADVPQRDARMGMATALRGDTLVATAVGSSTVQVFHKVAGSWQSASLMRVTGASGGGAFGFGVALSASSAVVADVFQPLVGAPSTAVGAAWILR
jgi:hypothetical protein